MRKVQISLLREDRVRIRVDCECGGFAERELRFDEEPPKMMCICGKPYTVYRSNAASFIITERGRGQ